MPDEVTPDTIEAQRYWHQMANYNDMGTAKPISTEWHRTSVRPRTRNGATEWHYICQFCGEEGWFQWQAIVPHHCDVLESHFNTSTGEQTPEGTTQGANLE